MFEKKISFVIPCYCSELTITDVVTDIFCEFPRDQYNIEIVLVNDCSKDNTFQVIKGLAHKYKEVVAVNLAKNFGQEGARIAGCSIASGDYIVSLDDDGQNPPREIHKLLNKIEQGYDVVFGKFEVKKHSRFKNFGSKLNDKMANIMMGKPKDLTLCSCFIMNSFVKNEIVKYKGPYPYIWGLILRTTSNISNEVIEHKSREVGESTYTFAKLIGLWLNGFTSFSVKPLRISALIGAIIAGCGAIYTLVILIQKLFFQIPMLGWASLMSVMLILFGTLLLMVGLVGEYVGRIYMNNNNAPQYVIREIVTDKIEEE